jgi:hypothetical protein
MSRWIEQYQTHPYVESWKRVKDLLSVATIDDLSVASSVAELARLNKVVGYLDGILSSLDPELMPLQTLDNFHSQASACADQLASFNSNRNVAHLANANNNADNLLSYVRPYLIVDGEAGLALRNAAEYHAKFYSEAVAAFSSRVGTIVDASNRSFDEIRGMNEGARNLERQLATARDNAIGSDGNGGYLHDVGEKIEDFNEKHAAASDFYRAFFEGVAGEESRRSALEGAVGQAIAQAAKAQKSVALAEGSIAKVKAFEVKILGSSGDGGEGSLSFAIDQQKQRLDEFEADQNQRTTALNERIESLLPGATSAGLATAYKDMKESFDAPINSASKLFFWTVAALMIGSIILCIDNVYWFGIEWVKLTDWESVLRSLTYKLPFFGPAIWLAYYASRRRSEFQRLQQEYAHKEALASSYESYRKQIEQLGEGAGALMPMLLEKAITAISHNASQTLDGKHGDKMPIQEAIERLFEKYADARAGASDKAAKR